MKTGITAILLLVCFSVTAQRATSERKFHLALPDEWKANRAMVKYLTDIAPQVFPKLADKQMCLGCKASYTLMFVYDSLSVENTSPNVLGSIPARYLPQQGGYAQRGTVSNYEGNTTYHLKGSWILMNKDSMAIAELVLVKPSEALLKKTKFSIPQYLAPNMALGEKAWRINPDDDPNKFIRNHPEGFKPVVTDILSVLEQKLRQISSK